MVNKGAIHYVCVRFRLHWRYPTNKADCTPVHCSTPLWLSPQTSHSDLDTVLSRRGIARKTDPERDVGNLHCRTSSVQFYLPMLLRNYIIGFIMWCQSILSQSIISSCKGFRKVLTPSTVMCQESWNNAEGHGPHGWCYPSLLEHSGISVLAKSQDPDCGLVRNPQQSLDTLELTCDMSQRESKYQNMKLCWSVRIVVVCRLSPGNCVL
jgi:hypothetical protein